MAKFGEGKWDWPALCAVVAVVAAGIAWPWYQDRRETSRVQAQAQAKRAAEVEAAEAMAFNAPIKPRVLMVEGVPAMMIEAKIKTRDQLTGLVSLQRCYVWRDIQLSTVAMSCPNDSELSPVE